MASGFRAGRDSRGFVPGLVDGEAERRDGKLDSETGTTLKSGAGGERLVAVTPGLVELLCDYVDDTRVYPVEESGREPLLATSRGRQSRSSMRRSVSRITAPCFRGEGCPGRVETPERKCPEAVTPHAVRRGSITHFLASDVPVEIVGDRMDVSRTVLDKHYDRRSEAVKLEQLRGYLDEVCGRLLVLHFSWIAPRTNCSGFPLA